MLGALPNSRHDVGSDDDDRDAARLGIRFQAPAHLPPVELRHREIEHDDVRAKDTNHLDGPLTACRFVNDEAGGTERQLVDLALGIVIVNQDYRGHLAERSADRYLDDSRRKKFSQLEPGAGVEPATY